MFERFTEKAIKVIMIAQEEACRLGHNFVGVEFIFLGLIGEATGIASQVLRQQGITLKNARIEVEKILGRGSGMITVEPPFTESAKLVLNNAVSIARQLEHESINTEHLLIGIIQEGESTARILQNLQVNPQDLAISLSQYFQQQSSNQLPQTVYVLLYNVGTDNEGIHTISVDDNHKILLFESQEDAATFARQLGEQNFPVPSVEAMKAEEILLFCKKSGYGWEFVPKGKTITPPVDRVKDYGEEWLKKGLLFQKMASQEEAAGRQSEAETMHSQAISCFGKVLDQNPQSVQALNQIAISYTALQQLEQAIRFYNSALELEPDNTLACFNRGLLLIQLGYLENALVDFERVIRLNSDDSEAWYFRGNILNTIGQIDDSIDSYNRSIEINPNSFDVWFQRSNAWYQIWEQFKTLPQSNQQKFNALKEFLINCYRAWEIEPNHPVTHKRKEWLEQEFLYRGFSSEELEVLAEVLSSEKQESLARFIRKIWKTKEELKPALERLDKVFEDSERTFAMLERIFAGGELDAETQEYERDIDLKNEQQRNLLSELIELMISRGVDEENIKRRFHQSLQENQNLIDMSFTIHLSNQIYSLLDDEDSQREMMNQPDSLINQALSFAPSPFPFIENLNMQDKKQFLIDFVYQGHLMTLADLCTFLNSFRDINDAKDIARHGFENLMIVQCIRLGILDKNNEDIFFMATQEDFQKNIESIKKYFLNLSQFSEANLRNLGLFALEHILTKLGDIYKDNRGAAYYREAENLEKSLLCFQTIFEFWKLTRSNEGLTRLHNFFGLGQEPVSVIEGLTYSYNRLGLAYLDRKLGNPEDNIDEAIKCFETGLDLDFVNQELRGNLQNNLAIAYRRRQRGNPQENLAESIKRYDGELERREEGTLAWANIKRNLASALVKLDSDDLQERVRNVRKAIKHTQDALEVLKKYENTEQEQASLQMNLGIFYSSEIFHNKGIDERIKNLNKAIDYYSNAIRIFDKIELRLSAGETRIYQGKAYMELGTLTKNSQMIEESFEQYERGLQVYNSEFNPMDYIRTHFIVGTQFLALRRYLEAYNTLKKGIVAWEEFRSNHILEEATQEDKQKYSEQFGEYYHLLVDSCIELGKTDVKYCVEALEYAERGKASNLVELLAQQEILPKSNHFAPDEYEAICQQLRSLRQEITSKQRMVQANAGNKENIARLLDDLHNKKQEKERLLEFINLKDPDFKFMERVQPIPYQDIQALIKEDSVILEWYFIEYRLVLFIVFPDSKYPIIEEYSDEELVNLKNLIKRYQSEYSRNKSTWINNLYDNIWELSRILQIEKIIIKYQLTKYQKLILIPHRYLHLMPLHAMPFSNGEVLIDKFIVSYAPSLQSLQSLQKRQKNNLENSLIIKNPSNKLRFLAFAEFEADFIGSLFSKAQMLSSYSANKSNLIAGISQQIPNCLHFACHAGFNPNNPLNSFLALAGEEKDYLFFSEIISLSLQGCSLVTLSACESGIVFVESVSDEYIGLPSGFLFAGSPSVVSSLWTVNDLSTSFLMMKFYEILLDKTQQISVPVALKMAQNWLKNLTSQQFILETDSIIDKLYSNKPRLAKSYKESARQFLVQNPEEYPFKNPSYWAAFIASGQ
jgi:CHAT domain-containing protein/tetratricopeptide (TPR) repeat protein